MRGRDVSTTLHRNNFRKRMSRKKDPKVFSRSADRSRVENTRVIPMRGGIRF